MCFCCVIDVIGCTLFIPVGRLSERDADGIKCGSYLCSFGGIFGSLPGVSPGGFDGKGLVQCSWR